MNAGTSNIINDAKAAVQRRDGALAQRLLAELPESEMPWLLLAQACNLLGNLLDEEAALQRQLALEPRNLPALILSGELKARMGDDRAAISFFQAALNQAATAPNVPNAFHPMLNRARDFIGQVQVKFEQHLIDGLK
ncbi:MAG: aspartyl/asparaginyl beta-hydroxylase domain-containing protein, partial [Sphingomonadaceae bacterium]|nr:aspartyl/asparaginyl beta-hydroxylase domain-containing protein [Sphingomonadaceae bacterium]